MTDDEDDETFLARRAAEEERKATATSCLVRSVHEDLAKAYRERLDVAAAATADLTALVDRIEEHRAPESGQG